MNCRLFVCFVIARILELGTVLSLKTTYVMSPFCQKSKAEIERLTNLSEKSRKEKETLEQMLDEKNAQLKDFENVAAMSASKVESQKTDLGEMKTVVRELEELNRQLQQKIDTEIAEKRKLERETATLKEQALKGDKQIEDLNKLLNNSQRMEQQSSVKLKEVQTELINFFCGFFCMSNIQLINFFFRNLRN